MIALICIILSGLFYGEKETIIAKKFQKHKRDTWVSKKWFPKFLAEWWEANNWHYSNPFVDWIMRYVLSMFKDGYHYCGSASVILAIVSGLTAEPLYLLIVSGIGHVLVSYILTALLLFIAHGLIAQASYHDWIKKLHDWIKEL